MRKYPAIFGGPQRVGSFQPHRQTAGKAPACQKRQSETGLDPNHQPSSGKCRSNEVPARLGEDL